MNFIVPFVASVTALMIVGGFMMTLTGGVFAGGSVSVRWCENSGEKECSLALYVRIHPASC